MQCFGAIMGKGYTVGAKQGSNRRYVYVTSGILSRFWERASGPRRLRSGSQINMLEVSRERRSDVKNTLAFLLLAACAWGQNKLTPEKEAAIKADLMGEIDHMKKQAQVMVDSVFSFGELGFQEFETSKYLTRILEKEGFKVERGYAGITTAWVASWGSGEPVISLGSDIDDIP